jgi:hypothetical protein
VDRAPIVVRVDDALGRAGEAGEILRAVQLAQGFVLVERRFEQDVIRQVPGSDVPSHRCEDASVHRLVEVLCAEVCLDLGKCRVVDHDSAKKRLLGLDVVWAGPEAGRHAGMSGHVFLPHIGQTA